MYVRFTGSFALDVQTSNEELVQDLLGRVCEGGGALYSLLHNGAVLQHKRSLGSQGVAHGAELKVIKGVVTTVRVFDPINKQPYTLQYGGEGSEVVMTAGLETYFNQLGGNKRVFLCKKYQARQCRAQAKCNSIHADRKRVAVLRAAHPVSEEVKQSEVVVDVLSTEDGSERFTVPCDRVVRTAGLRLLLDAYQRYAETGGSNGSTAPCGILCTEQHPEGMMEHCTNIHVDAAYLRHVRAMWRMPCCGQPGCSPHNAQTDTAYPLLGGTCAWRQFKVCDGGRGALWHQTLITPTKGLKELCDAASPAEEVLSVSMTRVCRPHQRRVCKWGQDCNNVHICRVKMPPGNTRTPGVLFAGAVRKKDGKPAAAVVAEVVERLPVVPVLQQPPLVLPPSLPVPVLPAAKGKRERCEDVPPVFPAPVQQQEQQQQQAESPDIVPAFPKELVIPSCYFDSSLISPPQSRRGSHAPCDTDSRRGSCVFSFTGRDGRRRSSVTIEAFDPETDSFPLYHQLKQRRSSSVISTSAAMSLLNKFQDNFQQADPTASPPPFPVTTLNHIVTCSN